MGVAEIIIGIALMVLSVGLVAVILSQTGKDQSLSGAITGASSDTFFGKAGGSTKEKLLGKITIAMSVVFVVLAVALTIMLV